MKMYLFILVNCFQKLISSLFGVAAAVVTLTNSTKVSLKNITVDTRFHQLLVTVVLQLL